MNSSILRSKAASVRPLMAPPVPNNPAVIPDSAPPVKALKTVGFNLRFLKIISDKLMPIRKMERHSSNMVLLKYLLKNEPNVTNSTAGIPIVMTNFLSNPFLNRAIFEMLLER